MSRIVLLMGLPGSGKTTWAERQNGAHIISADDFFLYRPFDPRLLPEAHAQCLVRFTRAVSGVEPHGLIIVDNTNTTLVELAPYVALAQAYGHVLEVRFFLCTPDMSERRNVHQVPRDVIDRMAQNIIATGETAPPWWPRPIVTHPLPEDHYAL